MNTTFHLDIVSPEGSIFSGDAEALHLRGGGGELGIFPGHLQLLTSVAPGAARIIHDGGKQEVLFISGGVLEVQPEQVNIMADVVERPQDVNEAAAQQAKKEAEKALSGKLEPADYRKTLMDLEEAIAKLRVIELMRQKRRR